MKIWQLALALGLSVIAWALVGLVAHGIWDIVLFGWRAIA